MGKRCSDDVYEKARSQQRADDRPRAVGPAQRTDDTVLNPANLEEFNRKLNSYGFEMRAGQTF